MTSSSLPCSVIKRELVQLNPPKAATVAPPATAVFSRTRTFFAPCSPISTAAARPAPPAPMMTMSYCSFWGCAGSTLSDGAGAADGEACGTSDGSAEGCAAVWVQAHRPKTMHRVRSHASVFFIPNLLLVSIGSLPL